MSSHFFKLQGNDVPTPSTREKISFRQEFFNYFFPHLTVLPSGVQCRNTLNLTPRNRVRRLLTDLMRAHLSNPTWPPVTRERHRERGVNSHIFLASHQSTKQVSCIPRIGAHRGNKLSLLSLWGNLNSSGLTQPNRSSLELFVTNRMLIKGSRLILMKGWNLTYICLE